MAVEKTEAALYRDPRYLINTPVGIDIHMLNKSYGENHVLADLSLSIRPGETFVILGRSGLGKTVLLRHVVGLERADSGEILLAGLPAASPEVRETLRIAFVFQASALFNSLTVGDNVGLWLREHRVCLDDDTVMKIVAEKLELVGLKGKEDIMPSHLSGGMKKRVAIARALTMNPDLILYDEPTAGLDPVISDTIGEVIVDLKERFRITSVVVTHDINLAFFIADRIALLHDRRIIAIGTPQEIKASRDPVVQEFITAQSKRIEGGGQQ